MSSTSQRMILVGTEDGLHIWHGDAPGRVDELAGREVSALVGDSSRWWALVGGRQVWRGAEGGHWALAATVPKGRPKATCLAVTSSGLLVGTARAHLMRLGDGELSLVAPFDAADGRKEWYTPWGAPADVRSIAVDAGGAVYANVHVGGVLRSTDGGATWVPTLDIEHDVHQVFTVPGQPGRVVVAAADGYGVSEDQGESWAWQNAGLHAHYCRAVALAGDTLLVSASTGHHGRRAAVYRRQLDADGPFERCGAGLPEWFADNVDTGCLAAHDRVAVIGTEDGSVYVSQDAGASWDTLAKGLAPVRSVALG
jgi:hypothetical protein